MTTLNTQLQNEFLEHMRTTEVPVTLFLVNGVKLQGLIESVDDQCILLKRDGHVQLVYKQALSTVMPQGVATDFVAKK